MCYAFKANEACGFGDNCKFSHAATKVGNVGKAKTHKPQAGIIGSPGDLVIITQACPLPSLRGLVGQAHTLTGNRLGIQIMVTEVHIGPGLDFANQWVDMASSIGLQAFEYIICPPDKRLALMAGHKTRSRSSATKGTGRYSLNAIFDSGCKTFMSFAQHLFANSRN